ncbi:MAG: hypothetical protein RL223_3314 [Pseudomonadota bacterium]|jgi:peptidoglycan/LPS O-acetylase OafA/YrhL
MSASPPPSATRRYDTLDGLRGVAALAVMAHHLTQSSSGPHLFSGASLAVDLFFCLSGFVLAESNLTRLLRDGALGDFVIRRLLRLYPLHLCGLLLGATALLLMVDGGRTSLQPMQAWQAIGLHAVYLPWLGGGTITVGQHTTPLAAFPVNDPAWSLCFEMVVNLAFALVVILACRRQSTAQHGAQPWRAMRKLPLFLLALAGAALLTLWTARTHWAAPGWGPENFIGGGPRVVWGFFSGVALWLLWQRVRDQVPRLHPAWLLVASLALFAREVSPSIWLLQTLVAVPLLVLLGAAARPATPRLDRMQQELGWLSYPLYCLHLPVLMLVNVLTAGHLPSPATVVAASALLGIVLAWAAGRWIDEPLRHRLQQGLQRTPKPADPPLRRRA